MNINSDIEIFNNNLQQFNEKVTEKLEKPENFEESYNNFENPFDVSLPHEYNFQNSFYNINNNRPLNNENFNSSNNNVVDVLPNGMGIGIGNNNTSFGNININNISIYNENKTMLNRCLNTNNIANNFVAKKLF